MTRVRNVEQLDDDLYRVGSRHVPVYLLHTGKDRWALIEGGISADVEVFWEQLLCLIRAPEDVHDWLITHKHFDHCGLLPRILPRLPKVRVRVPIRMKESLADGGACRVIASLNASLVPPSMPMLTPADWQGLPLETVQAGDKIILSDTHSLQVREANGHSDDQVVYYDSLRERLFASDALGEFDPAENCWRPLAFHDYGTYLDTLDNLLQLPVRQVLAGHGDKIVGASAQMAVAGALIGCAQLEREIYEANRNGQGGESIALALHLRWRDLSASFLPNDLHLASMRRLVQLVQQHAEHASGGAYAH